jgi:hypothetical protein
MNWRPLWRTKFAVIVPAVPAAAMDAVVLAAAALATVIDGLLVVQLLKA